MTRTEQAWLRLYLTPGLGRVGTIRLIEAFGSPEAALAASPRAWTEQARVRPAVAASRPAEGDAVFIQTLETLDRLEVGIISLWDQHAYPEPLRSIYDPPALLFVRGKLPEQQGLAVVGARRASPDGIRLTRTLCRQIAAQGISIVSGLARGIDRAAHEGALMVDGATVAVLGCGIDRVYPRENEPLYFEILQKGGAILSEYPPGTPPLAQHFPGRNRIISGMCRGVLVVEAAARSGSLITAEFALEQGREVFAVPGPVNNPGNQGTNQLLKEGARLVTESADILDIFKPGCCPSEPPSRPDPLLEKLSGQFLNVYRELQDSPLHLDELARKCGLTPMEVSAILLHLELEDGATQLPGMRFVRKRSL
ncbi:MAG: DNA-processing protein DprA [Syntrophotalea sp.]|jgi:DNA processing protein|uniref:DNA-processing protein DprA n=1 Tax=Syntrophotalea sp. TaxID=2812029 RepID=UPI003D103908